jgi:plastocyanin
MSVPRALVVLAMSAAFVLTVGCGESASPPVATNAVVIREYEFVPKHIIVRRNTTLTPRNDGKIAHNLTVVKGSDPLVRPDKLIGTSTFLGGRSVRLRMNLPPGRYLMICSVPGHRQLGMYGTLTVK